MTKPSVLNAIGIVLGGVGLILLTGAVCLAVYFTPPDGKRMLVYGSNHTLIGESLSERRWRLTQEGRLLIELAVQEPVDSSEYDIFEIDWEASPLISVFLAWPTADGFARQRLGKGETPLSDHPKWSGQISRLLLAFEPVYGAISTEEARIVELEKMALSNHAAAWYLVESTLNEHAAQPLWTTRAINTLGRSGLALPVAVSCLFTLILALIMSRRGSWLISVLTVQLIFSWLLLDAVWMWQLSEQRQATHDQFSGLEAQLGSTALDYPLANFLSPIDDLTGDGQVRRVLVMTPERFYGQRASWHLLPVPAVWWPNPDHLLRESTGLSEGDVIVVYRYPEVNISEMLTATGFEFEMLVDNDNGGIAWLRNHKQ